jgi:hypothetical protein
VAAAALAFVLAGGLGLMLGSVTPVPSLHWPEFRNPFAGDPFAVADPAGGDWLDRSEPVRVDIDRLGVHAPLTPLGLDSDGDFEVPSMRRPHEAGWFEPGPTPGEFGPAVLLGHVDTARGPAVFFAVERLEEGDAIEVTREDGIVVVYEVAAVESFPKGRLPYEEVFGVGPEPGLRLITCGGVFDRGTGDYTENTVVFADYAGRRRATGADLARPLNGRDAFGG